jgi:hypothetical protein
MKLLRSFGRIALGFVAFLSGAVMFALTSAVGLSLTQVWFWKISGLVGLATAVAVFELFDRLGWVQPVEREGPTSLYLTEREPRSRQ